MSKFQVVVTNKVKVGKCKPGQLRFRFKNKKKLQDFKFVSCLFVKGGTTEENFKRCYNVEYCAGTQKELEP
jgi:hypothetical protein